MGSVIQLPVALSLLALELVRLSVDGFPSQLPMYTAYRRPNAEFSRLIFNRRRGSRVRPGLLSPSGRESLWRSVTSNEEGEQGDGEIVDTVVAEDDLDARSAFGTHEYWSELYAGRGDFPADEFSWYYSFDAYRNILSQYVRAVQEPHILLPGIGNDPVLLDLLQCGFRYVTATDYTESAIERQRDLLSYSDEELAGHVELLVADARSMSDEWTERFDLVLEKGCLDAVFLSGDGNVEKAARELERVLRPGGILISISGVVPQDLRKLIFHEEKWTWLRDGSSELRAGCFVMKRNGQ